VRRVQTIAEITGMEGDTPQLQDIFTFRSRGRQGKRLAGEFVATGIVPRVVEQMRAENIDVPMHLFQPGM
jgi:pilus assembly protein CpaF